MFKHLKILISIFIVLSLALAGCGKAKLSAIPAKSDYSLIPVYTLDGRSVYLNASATPLEFFSISSNDLPEIEKMVMDLKPQKPLVYVATFFNTSNVNEAIKETKSFVEKNKISGSVVIQAGEPHAYVKNVPSLVTLDQAKDGQAPSPRIIEGKPSKEQLTAALTNPTNTAKADSKK
ncbi:hypothetical protein [Desulfitobacterium sp. AusDCA]|uniref:hypothetical protein n=1 Tax=Desulfitobacterium sp. AusDCA TaxID=3240383 RepID=UPI003DA766F6